MAEAGDQHAYELFQQGLADLEDGSTRDARASLEAADDLEPGTSSIQEALGRTYFRLRKYEAAAEVFAEIVEREPLDDYAHFCLARCHDRLGNAPMALRHYRLAASLGPQRPVYRRTLRRFMAKREVLGDD